jgi:hypothetical protein
MRFDRALFRITFAACIVSALVLIWGHRFLPISDYPDWVFEGSIAAQLLHGKTFDSYAFNHYPVPNAGAVALIGLLSFVFSPEISGKIVLSLCVILLALSSTYLLRSLRRDADNSLVLIPLLFLTNTYFFWGELSYILGLSLFFFYCGYLFRRVNRSEPINWWLAGTASIAIFFCHFLPYATAVLVTLTLFVAESRTELLGSFAISFAPSVGLTVWYAVERLPSSTVGSGWKFWKLHQLAGRLIAAFSPFPEFLPWLGIHAPGMKVFALLNLLITVLLILVLPLSALLWAKGRVHNRGVLACAFVCAFAVIVSPYAFAGIITPGERFLYPAVWIGLCSLAGERLPDSKSLINRTVTLTLVSLLACQAFFLQIYVGAVSNDLATLYAKLRAANSQAEFCAIYVPYVQQSWDLPHRIGFDLLLTNHASVPRLPYYLYIERNLEAPIFQTGIIEYKGHEGNEDSCKPSS